MNLVLTISKTETAADLSQSSNVTYLRIASNSACIPTACLPEPTVFRFANQRSIISCNGLWVIQASSDVSGLFIIVTAFVFALPMSFSIVGCSIIKRGIIVATYSIQVNNI